MARSLGYVEDVEQFARLMRLKQAMEEVRALIEDAMEFIIDHNSRDLTGEPVGLDFHYAYRHPTQQYSHHQIATDLRPPVRGSISSGSGSIEAWPLNQLPL
jgi:hypothetical protein